MGSARASVRAISPGWHTAIVGSIALSAATAKSSPEAQHRDSLEGPDGSAQDAKYGFSRLIGPARAESVMIAKHGRPVVVVMAGEEYERLKSKDASKRLIERT